MLAEENIEEYVEVPRLAGGEDGEYVLRVRGDDDRTPASSRATTSSCAAGDRQDGEIVVALVGEEATVKRFFSERDHIRLQPENHDDGADPHARTCACSGSVVGVFRRVRMSAVAERCVTGTRDAS